MLTATVQPPAGLLLWARLQPARHFCNSNRQNGRRVALLAGPRGIPVGAAGTIRHHEWLMAESPAALRDGLGEVVSYLPAALGEEFSGHPVGDLLVRAIPDALAVVVTDPGYKLQGSRGRGRWAETVWVAVFDRLVTESAQQGYYVVYLFRRDGGGVYLSLNQGTTAVHEEVGGRRYRGVLEDRAAVYAGLIRDQGLDGLDLGLIDLGGGGMLTRGYESGNVAARHYDADVMPSEAELHGDLSRFLALYRRLIEANDHLIDADTPADEPETQQDESHGGLEEARRLRWHLRAERNPRLVAEAKRIHGSSCAICGFNYAGRYGALGDGYIEAPSPNTVRQSRGPADKARPATRFCGRMRKLPPDDSSKATSTLVRRRQGRSPISPVWPR